MSDRRTSLRVKYNARIFSFCKTSRPTTTATGSECLLYVLYCKIKIRCISQGLQVGYEWSEFKRFSLHVLRNVIFNIKCLLSAKTLFKMDVMTYSFKKQSLL